MPLYGLSLFLPTIIKELGYTSTTAQLLTVPIYVTAALLTVLIAYLADHTHLRSPFILALFLFQLLGFALCLADLSPGITYAGVFIAGAAIYPTHPTNVAWLSNNLAGTYKRAVGVGLQISLGNLAGAAASNFYRRGDAPRYVLGHSLEIGVIVMGICATGALAGCYRRVNRQRRWRLERGEREAFTEEELSVLGDKAVTFRYTL
jgi:MFS family permease